MHSDNGIGFLLIGGFLAAMVILGFLWGIVGPLFKALMASLARRVVHPVEARVNGTEDIGLYECANRCHQMPPYMPSERVAFEPPGLYCEPKYCPAAPATWDAPLAHEFAEP